MLLKTGETIIADAKEVVSDDTVCGYFLTNPHLVETKEQVEQVVLTESNTQKSNYEIDVILTPWLILSKDKEFIVEKYYIATICNPIDSVEKMYNEKIGISLKTTDDGDDKNAE